MHIDIFKLVPITITQTQNTIQGDLKIKWLKNIFETQYWVNARGTSHIFILFDKCSHFFFLSQYFFQKFDTPLKACPQMGFEKFNVFFRISLNIFIWLYCEHISDLSHTIYYLENRNFIGWDKSFNVNQSIFTQVKR